MIEDQTETPTHGRRHRRVNKKTDGSDGRPMTVEQSGVSGQNAALKERANVGEGVDPNHPLKANVTIIDRHLAIVDTDRKKYALCGFASSTRHLIPIEDPSWEIWGMNQLYRHVKRADRWFDVHWNWNTELVPGTDHEGWIRSCGIPVYMTEAHKHLPTTVRFPVDVLIAEFTDYYTSTVAHMMALAIWEIDRRVMADLNEMPEMLPVDAIKAMRSLYAEYTIGLFGIDLIVGEEYFWQKSCTEFWIGAAAVGRGIQVYVPPSSALCKQRFRYGYQTEPATILKPAEINKHKASLVEERDKKMKELFMLDGAVQTDDYWNELIELRLRGGDIRL